MRLIPVKQRSSEPLSPVRSIAATAVNPSTRTHRRTTATHTLSLCLEAQPRRHGLILDAVSSPLTALDWLQPRHARCYIVLVL